MKTQTLFLILFVSLAICACENPWMANILQPKTITFDSNGGSPVPPQTILKNEKISQPETPVRTGYFFSGWFTDNGTFDNIWDFNNIPTGDMILYAGWNDTGTSPSNPNNLNPVAGDFNIEGVSSQFVYDGTSKAVTVTAKPGKTSGKITIYYQKATDGAYSEKTTAPPSAIGTYRVTFDVEAAEGWNAAYELEAGILIISEQTANPGTPQAGDFIVSGAGTFTYDGSAKAVTVTANTDKSQGKVTIYYKETAATETSTTAPTNAGTYTVTFDVAEALNWKAVDGLSAGTLTISKATPVAGDYEISGNREQTLGSVTGLTVKVKPDGIRSPGTVTVYYQGGTGTASNQSTNPPSTVGEYTVTFNVTETDNWNAATGLSAGTLKINEYPSFTSVSALAAYLGDLTPNQSGDPYKIALTITNENDLIALSPNLRSENLYVILDLSNSTIDKIPANAFYAVSGNSASPSYSLAGIIIPANVESIGTDAFRGCTSLTSVTFLGNNITSIGNDAFHGCINLTSVTIPESVTSIGDGAFASCEKLTQVTFEGTISSSEFANISTSPAFPGDLRIKFYAENNAVGTPGTYTRQDSGTTWTKQ